MSEKIDLEFSANDRELTKQINDLKKQLNSLGNAGDMSKGLSDNLSAIRQNIDLMKQMTSQTRSARLEMERFGNSLNTTPSNSGNARQRKKSASNAATARSYQDRARQSANESISIEQYAKSKANSRTISSFTKGYGSYYDQRNTDTQDVAYQRAMAKYQQRTIRNGFNNQFRDIGTANRGLTDSEKRISNLNASGGYVTANQNNTALRNRGRARDIITDDGRYANANDFISSNNSRMESNKAEFGNLFKKQSDITDGASGRELTKAEKEIIKSYEHKQKLLLEENDGLTKLNTRIRGIADSYDKLDSTLQNAKQAPTGGIRGTMFNRSRNVANSMVFGTAATLGGFAMAGNNIINQEQPMTRAIGASNGTYNSRAAQLSAQNAGRSVGLTGRDMLSSQMAYMQGAGYTGQGELNAIGKDTGMFAKLTGMSVGQSNAITQMYGQDVNGGSSQGLRELQNTFYGSLKQAGLTSKSFSQASAMSGILGTYGSLRGGDVSNLLAQGQVGMQSALGSTGNKALQGANGASFMNQMNSSIIGQGANSKFMQMALMNSDPSKYNGSYQGYANIIDQTQNGLDGTNLKAIAGLGNRFGGGDKRASASIFSGMLKNNFGVSVTSKTAGDIQALASSGQLDGLGSKDAIKKMQASGAITKEQAKQMQQGSSDATYDKGQANFEKAATSIGNLTRNVSSLGLVMTGGSVVVTALAAAAGAAAVSLTKLAGADMLSSIIKGKAAGGTGGGFFGGTRASGAGGGGKVSGGIFSGGAVTGTRMAGAGGGKGTMFTRMANSKIGMGATSLASKATPMLGNVAKFGGKVAGPIGLGLMAVDTVSQIVGAKNGSQAGGGIGQGAGAIVGGAIGTVAGPIGTAIGSAAGAIIGNMVGKGVGGLFDKINKNDKGTQPSKSTKSALAGLANNMGGDNKSKTSFVQSMLMKNQGLSQSDAAKQATSIMQTANKQNVNVNVNGTVRHKGEVEDSSQLNASKNTVLKQIFAGTNADQTK